MGPDEKPPRHCITHKSAVAYFVQLYFAYDAHVTTVGAWIKRLVAKCSRANFDLVKSE